MGAIGIVTYGEGTDYETRIEISAIQVGNDVKLTADVTKGVADLRGLFFDIGGDPIAADSKVVGKKIIAVPYVDDIADVYSWGRGDVTGNSVTKTMWGEGLVNDLGNGANVKGGFANPTTSPLEDGSYDFGVELGTQGIGSDDIASATFTLKGLRIEEIYNQAFAVRLTSTDDPLLAGVNREGSLKLSGVFDPPGDDDDDQFTGFSHGYWKTHGPYQETKPNDWDVSPSNPNFEEYFGLTSGADWSWDYIINGGGPPVNVTDAPDISFYNALWSQGSDQYALAREAVAAVLNSLEEDVTYKFDTASIKQWTKGAFDWTGSLDTGGYGAWNNQQDAILGLKNLFEEYNVREPQVII